MADISQLKPGDVVRIVSAWPDKDGRQNTDGFMDKYLGTQMTVRGIIKSRALQIVARMEEDQNDPVRPGGWSWFPEMIDYVVACEEEPEDESPAEEDIAGFFGF